MTDFLSMNPDQIEKELASLSSPPETMGNETQEEKKTPTGDDEEVKEVKEVKETTTPTGTGGDTFQETDTDQQAEEKPLNMDEVKDVSSGAFKEAYDYYKKNAVGDPKTRETYLGQLRDELAEYKDGEDGTKKVTRGLLKNFTDDNHQIAFNAGKNVIHAALKELSSTKFPNFEAFKKAREQAAANIHSKLQNNVAYPELGEYLLKALEDLSNKKGLEFGLSDTEKEKEKAILTGGRRNVEQQKKSAELQEALMNSQQIQSNTEMERRLLAEQNEKQSREWKMRIDLESKLRQQQIAADLKSGFDERAQLLRKELADSSKQTMAMMMQMQKESMESQNKLTQFLTLEMNKQPPPPPPPPPRPQGLLTSILSPVAGFLGNVLGKLL